MKICLFNEKAAIGKTLTFAGEELEYYLSRMGRPGLNLQLGVADLTAMDMPAVADTKLDDQYIIEVKEEPAGEAAGKILGINERSVLLGVYRYLSEIGCAFLRPGKQYEVIPLKTELKDYAASVKHTASLRHRGVCIEGSNSIENVLDFIDWLPKVGGNSFFLQFEYPYTFLERFYTSDVNPYRKPGSFTMEDAVRAHEAFDAALKLRGMMQHRVGHGWTSKALGCTATGWDTEEKQFTEKERMMIAEVNGKRELWEGIPSNTNMCMSNPDAIEAYADGVVEYVKANPNTTYLHLWLADGTNNHCECEKCRGKRPSDHYIDVLNRVDERLTEIGSDAKLVMLIYVDLLWSPIVSQLKNPGRFALMLAPYTRTFNLSYDDVEPAEEEPPFELNHLKFPKELEYYIRFLRDWQKVNPGCDSFDYEYYLTRAGMSNPTQVGLAKVIARDFRIHKELGMNGVSSCQNLRMALPNALGGYIMFQIGADTSLSFEETAAKYYTACYGEKGPELLKIMEQISDCFDPDFVGQSKPDTVPELAEKLSKVPALADQIEKICDEHELCAYEAQEKMWAEMKYFAEFITVHAACCQLRCEGKKEEAVAKFDGELMPMMCRYEMSDQSALDIWRMHARLRRALAR